MLEGFPLLWKSVKIYRAPLPFDRVDSFSSQIESKPLSFPCRFLAIFIGFDFMVSNGNVGAAIERKMSDLSHGGDCGGCGGNYSVSVAVGGGGIDAVYFGGKLRGNDEDADELVKSVVSEYGGGNAYSVVVVNEEGEVRSVVGKYRHAWIVGRVEEEEAVLHVAEVFVKVFVNGGDVEGSVRSEFMPVGADGRIVLSFSLLNADPRDWIYDWYEL